MSPIELVTMNWLLATGLFQRQSPTPSLLRVSSDFYTFFTSASLRNVTISLPSVRSKCTPKCRRSMRQSSSGRTASLLTTLRHCLAFRTTRFIRRHCRIGLHRIIAKLTYCRSPSSNWLTVHTTATSTDFTITSQWARI